MSARGAFHVHSCGSRLLIQHGNVVLRHSSEDWGKKINLIHQKVQNDGDIVKLSFSEYQTMRHTSFLPQGPLIVSELGIIFTFICYLPAVNKFSDPVVKIPINTQQHVPVFTSLLYHQVKCSESN